MADHGISREEISYWAGVREKFLLQPDIAYLNGGIFGPCPRVVVDRIAELNALLNTDVGEHMARTLGPLNEETREKLASFTGTTPDRIAMVLNTTMGMNTVAQELTLEAGGEILMSNHEYPAMEALWRYVAKRDGLTVRAIELPNRAETKEEVVAAFAAAMNERTRVVTFCHVYYFTGLMVPAREVCSLAHEHGAITAIDGAHSLGQIDIDLSDIGSDFYIGSCHKWLLGPKGTGMIYVSGQLQNVLRPLFIGDDLRPAPTARRYDVAGTRDQTHFAALGTTIDFMREVGWPDKVQSYCYRLSRYLKERLLEIEGLTLTVPMGSETSCFMSTFVIDGIDMMKLSQCLWDEGIENSCPQIHGVSYLRASVHFFNTCDEVDRLIGTVKEIIEKRRHLVEV